MEQINQAAKAAGIDEDARKRLMRELDAVARPPLPAGPIAIRKRPVLVQGMAWAGGAEAATPVIDWVLANGGTARYHDELWDSLGDNLIWPEHIAIDTLEGTMRATPGDWIIRGVKGEFYPCKPAVLADTYDILG